MRSFKLVAAFVLLFAHVSTVAAADLVGYATPSCALAGQSQILSLPPDEIEPIVAGYWSSASAALADDAVVDSRRPAFVWASQAKFQCGKAVSYFQTNTADADSIEKCDCFYQRMLAYR